MISEPWWCYIPNKRCAFNNQIRQTWGCGCELQRAGFSFEIRVRMLCAIIFSVMPSILMPYICRESIYHFFSFLKRILKWTKLKHSLKGLTQFSPSPPSHSQNLTSLAIEKYLVLYSTVLNRYENACFDVTHDPCKQYLIYQISNKCEVHVNTNNLLNCFQLNFVRRWWSTVTMLAVPSFLNDLHFKVSCIYKSVHFRSKTLVLHQHNPDNGFFMNFLLVNAL